MFNLFKKLLNKILSKLGYTKSEVKEIIPVNLKNQIFHIVTDCIGFVPKITFCRNYSDDEIIETYHRIIKSYCDELGVLSLNVPSANTANYCLIFYEDFFTEEDLKRNFLLIEIFFKELKKQYSYKYWEASNRLNKRFKEHLFGYRFELGKIISCNSYFLQANVVEPAFVLINNKTFSGAEKEFRQALDDYKQDNNIAAINSCGRALESTMKIICDLNKWEYGERDTAGRLINICREKELFEDFFYVEITKLLTDGAPRLRNAKTGHGAGAKNNEIPDFYVDYMIHTTATCIVFLIRANEHYKLTGKAGGIATP